MNSFTFLFSGKLSTSPSTTSPGEVFLVEIRFFFSSILSIFYHSVLAYKVSAKQSADDLIGVPLYISYLSLAVLKILPLLLTVDILIIMYLVVGLLGFIFGNFWMFWIKTSVSFPILAKFSAIIQMCFCLFLLLLGLL